VSTAWKAVPRKGGYTLIEILVALLVLLIGLSSVVSLVWAAKRVGGSSVDRNVAKAIVAEAVADIERIHLITADMQVVPPPPADDVGLFIETIASATGPNMHDAKYSVAAVNGKTFSDQINMTVTMFSPSVLPENMNVLIWPFSNEAKYVGGLTNRLDLDTKNSDINKNALAYRVVYRLERKNAWTAAEDKGLYALTLVVYRDVDRKGGKLDQLTDPLVVYLRDRQVR
jgi:prepilin-type N-terminal cleavage/methylation domain-containing protein